MSSTLRTTKALREYKRAATDVGAAVVECWQTLHYHLILEANGQKKTFVTATSSGDHRSLQNFKSSVKRWVRETYVNNQNATR